MRARCRWVMHLLDRQRWPAVLRTGEFRPPQYLFRVSAGNALRRNRRIVYPVLHDLRCALGSPTESRGGMRWPGRYVTIPERRAVSPIVLSMSRVAICDEIRSSPVVESSGSSGNGTIV